MNDACGMCYTSGTTGLPKEFCIPIALLIYMLQHFLLMQGILAMRIRCYSSFRNFMLWLGFPYPCLLSGSDMVLPLPIYNPKRLLICKKEKSQKEWRPNIWLGSRNEAKPTQRETST
jgi:fatty-acyl-CoA synthase